MVEGRGGRGEILLPLEILPRLSIKYIELLGTEIFRIWDQISEAEKSFRSRSFLEVKVADAMKGW